MASNTSVNPQITDAVAQIDMGVIGASPAVAMGMLYQMMATSVGHSMQNATNFQQGMQQIEIAAVATGCAKIAAVPPSKPAASSSDASQSPPKKNSSHQKNGDV